MHFLAHETPKNIGLLLIVIVALWGLYKMAVSYCERQGFDPSDPAEQERIAAEHVAKVELRRADMAETLRVSKLL